MALRDGGANGRHIDPLKERSALFKDLPREQPIHMLNLIRLHERAAYPDGREASGLEAYRAYAREAGPVFAVLAERKFGSASRSSP